MQQVVRIARGNTKLGREIWTTFAPIAQTCPTSCPHKGNGCYVQAHHVSGGYAAQLALEAHRRGLSALDLARIEAQEIWKAAHHVAPGTPLRLHEAGDCATAEAAEIIAAACNVWPGPVWTYTHAWREVPRSAWGRVHVFASVETEADAVEAVRRGYAPAIVVADFPSERAWRERRIKWIPCPAETKDKTCATCRLCFLDHVHDDVTTGIAFRAHGRDRRKVSEKLVQLRRGSAA